MEIQIEYNIKRINDKSGDTFKVNIQENKNKYCNKIMVDGVVSKHHLEFNPIISDNDVLLNQMNKYMNQKMSLMKIE